MTRRRTPTAPLAAPTGAEFALPGDAAELALLHAVAAEHLVSLHGDGHWSNAPTARGIASAIATPTVRVMVLRDAGRIVATLMLATRKPWAIDVTYFTPVKRALYLTSMAVLPALQRRGLGRRLLGHAPAVAREWGAEAIRLDAYDAAAGAGGFYAKCGFEERGRVVYRRTPLVYFEHVLPAPR